MATISMDLDDFNSLMGLGLQRRRALFLDLLNTGLVKAGDDEITGPDGVILTPTGTVSDTLENTVVTRVKTAIAAAA